MTESSIFSFKNFGFEVLLWFRPVMGYGSACRVHCTFQKRSISYTSNLSVASSIAESLWDRLGQNCFTCSRTCVTKDVIGRANGGLHYSHEQIRSCVCVCLLCLLYTRHRVNRWVDFPQIWQKVNLRKIWTPSPLSSLSEKIKGGKRKRKRKMGIFGTHPWWSCSLSSMSVS